MATTWLVLLMLGVVAVECRVCTRIVREEHVKTESYPAECHQSYEERCGWFSLKMCTFNETVPCVKHHNRTIALYRVVENCCPGYRKLRNGKCVRDEEKEDEGGTTDTASQSTNSISASVTSDTSTGGMGVTDPSSPSSPVDGGKGEKHGSEVKTGNEEEEKSMEDGHSSSADTVTVIFDDQPEDTSEGSNGRHGYYSDDEDDDDTFFLGISHGAYAGIVCGILFVACVALLTALHYRKRRQKLAKMSGVTAEQDAAQKQQMIPLEKVDSPAVTT